MAMRLSQRELLILSGAALPLHGHIFASSQIAGNSVAVVRKNLTGSRMSLRDQPSSTS
jgi:hypothetical protein